MDTNVITEIIKEDDDKKIDDVNNKGMKRKERLEQNRISARESRKRKKSMIGELQRTVIKLSRENKDLNDRNEHFRRQLIEIASKYPNVVPVHAVMTVPPIAPGLINQQNVNTVPVAHTTSAT